MPPTGLTAWIRADALPEHASGNLTWHAQIHSTKTIQSDSSGMPDARKFSTV